MPTVTATLSPSDPSPPSLEEAACQVRDIHLQMLERHLDSPDTRDTCLYASVLLAALVGRFTGWQTEVAGGDYVDDRGQHHGHYWVFAWHASSGDTRVLDVTADQFGAPPVLVLTPAQAHARYVPGDPAIVREHLALEGLEF